MEPQTLGDSDRGHIQMSGAEIAVAGRQRYRLIDALRGAALVAMIGYHIAWDLFYLRVFEVDITAEPGWIAAQLAILGSFVFLAGASLVLAHGEAIRWRSFWRREAILVGAALTVSIGTCVAFGEYFAFFGVLHAIALFSLLALPFLRAPLWLVAIVVAVVIVAPFLWQDAAFMSPWLAWIGFWPLSPPTVDLVPIFPWFGVTLGGVLVMRLVLASPVRTTLATWQGGPIGRALAFIGRWSLIIYLLHQVLIYGALSGLVMLLPAPEPPELVMPTLSPAEEFSLSCTPSCTRNGGSEAYCTAYCACALEQIDRGDLWEAIGADEQTPAQQSDTSQVINLCRAMAEDSRP
jgi:uncharacterized membrane protein